MTQFARVLDDLVARYRLLVDGVESVTMVYDAGQNSRDNQAVVDGAGIGFVGSLPPGDHPDLLALPRSRYTVVDADRYPGLTCVDTTVTALGVTRRAVLTHSPTLHAAQSRGFDQTLAKARARLGALQARLAGGNTRRPRTAVEAKIDQICAPRWVDQVLSTTLTGETPTQLRLTFRTDTRARRRLEETLFGKRILFTNRDQWTTADVVAAYRSQHEVEAGFRQMKDPQVVSFGPMHHWTGQPRRFQTGDRVDNRRGDGGAGARVGPRVRPDVPIADDPHHEGAIRMANCELARGRSAEAGQVAESIRTTPSADIARMLLTEV